MNQALIDQYWLQNGFDKKDIKSCKYCKRGIIWKQEGGKWVAYDHLIRDKHNDFCHTGDHKFAVGDNIISFWKNATIIYTILAADKNALVYIVEQPKNSHKRYASKNFSFKMVERVATKLSRIGALLYT